MTLAIIGCGAAKRAEPSPALELYTGNLYRARRAYLEAVTGRVDYVASALYGLIPAAYQIEPYELALPGCAPITRALWALNVCGRVCELVDATKETRIVAAVAGPYAAWIPLVRDARPGLVIEVPAAGLQLGASLAWYRRELEAVRS